MAKNPFIERMEDINEEAQYPTGFDDCIVGIGFRCSQEAIFVMDQERSSQN